VLPELFEPLEPELPELSEPLDLELPELDLPEDLELPELRPFDDELLEGEDRPELLMVDLLVFDFLVDESTLRLVEDLDLERTTFFVSFESFDCLIAFRLEEPVLLFSELLFRLTNRVDSLEGEVEVPELRPIVLLGEFLRVLLLFANDLF
jgi:hypothetical protein